MNIFGNSVDEKSQSRIQDDFWVGAGLNIWLDGDINAHDWKSLSLLGKVIAYIWTLLFVGINGVSRDT